MAKSQGNPKAASVIGKDDLIVITGAGGFIAGALARDFHDQGFTNIRGVDKKPVPDWYQKVEGVECLSLDLSDQENAVRGFSRNMSRKVTFRTPAV